jgi:hypothetical protein
VNKKIAIIIGALVLVLLLGGGAFVLTSKKGPTPTPTPEGQQTVGELSPDDIGLKLELRDDSKAVKFLADKLDDIAALEWEFYYDADVPASERIPGEEVGKVTQSFGGDVKLKSGQKTYESDYRELGTCSAKCRYDTGVEEVKILMKVTKKDGSLYQVEDSITL